MTSAIAALWCSTKPCDSPCARNQGVGWSAGGKKRGARAQPFPHPTHLLAVEDLAARARVRNVGRVVVRDPAVLLAKVPDEARLQPRAQLDVQVLQLLKLRHGQVEAVAHGAGVEQPVDGGNGLYGGLLAGRGCGRVSVCAAVKAGAADETTRRAYLGLEVQAHAKELRQAGNVLHHADQGRGGLPQEINQGVQGLSIRRCACESGGNVGEKMRRAA